MRRARRRTRNDEFARARGCQGGGTETREGVRTCFRVMAQVLGARGRAEARVVVLETRWGRDEDVSGVCDETGPAESEGV